MLIAYYLTLVGGSVGRNRQVLHLCLQPLLLLHPPHPSPSRHTHAWLSLCYFASVLFFIRFRWQHNDEHKQTKRQKQGMKLEWVTRTFTGRDWDVSAAFQKLCLDPGDSAYSFTPSPIRNESSERSSGISFVTYFLRVFHHHHHPLPHSPALSHSLPLHCSVVPNLLWSTI